MPLQPRPETIKALQAVAEELFEVTKVDRTTIRIDTPNDRDYPVLAEARIPGMGSLTGGMSLEGYKPIDIHEASTVIMLKNEREIIIQKDARVDPPLLPALWDYYGVIGQMLTPLEHEGEFVGILSAHSIEPREWTDQDIKAMHDATDRTHEVLAEANWVKTD